MKPLKLSLSIVGVALMMGGVMTGPADAHPHHRVDCFKVGGCPGINHHHRHWWGHHGWGWGWGHHHWGWGHPGWGWRHRHHAHW